MRLKKLRLIDLITVVDSCLKTKKKFGCQEKLREFFKKKTELLSQRLLFKTNSTRRIFDQIPPKS